MSEAVFVTTPDFMTFPDTINSANEDTRMPTVQSSIRFVCVTAPTLLDERLFAVLHLVDSSFHIARFCLGK
jgi:hypothetical protein